LAPRAVPPDARRRATSTVCPSLWPRLQGSACRFASLRPWPAALLLALSPLRPLLDRNTRNCVALVLRVKRGICIAVISLEISLEISLVSSLIGNRNAAIHRPPSYIRQ
ncbi:hypothetical protein, partial [Cupriavidus sp. HPC(L)]|uniref:hypothetical protein n=1 Tax=Cupriavidus sp. HPC(L) TaxID=1217418 RepID=UPI001C0FDA1D